MKHLRKFNENFSEHDMVTLLEPVGEIEKGSVCAIVHVHKNGEGFIIEDEHCNTEEVRSDQITKERISEDVNTSINLKSEHEALNKRREVLRTKNAKGTISEKERTELDKLHDRQEQIEKEFGNQSDKHKSAIGKPLKKNKSLNEEFNDGAPNIDDAIQKVANLIKKKRHSNYMGGGNAHGPEYSSTIYAETLSVVFGEDKIAIARAIDRAITTGSR